MLSDLLKSLHNGFANCCGTSFRIMLFILSGQEAYPVGYDLSVVVMSSSVIVTDLSCGCSAAFCMCGNALLLSFKKGL